MRILIITGIFPPDMGGPATYIPQLAASLVANGETVKVITLSDSPFPQDNYPYQVYRIARQQLIFRRFRETVRLIRHLGREADLILANGLFNEVHKANQTLKKPQVNKIVADYAWETASRKKWTQLDMPDFQKEKSLLFNLLRRRRNYPAVQADALITPSNFLKKVIDSWGYKTKRIDVIPNGFIPPVSKVTTSLKLPPLYLVSIGRLIPFKQFDKLIIALKELPEAYHLVIIGDGPAKNYLEALTRKLALSNRVQFLGRLSYAETYSILQGASLFLLLTLSEAFPHTILEAMAAGIPIVAANTGGIPEIINSGENGILVPVNDMMVLKDAVMNILTNQELQLKFIGSGQKKVQELSWENCFAKTYELLKKTASAK